MKRIWKWLVPLTLSVFVLSVPMVAAAYVTYGGPWDGTTANGTVSPVSNLGLDITDAYHAYVAGTNYFQINLAGNTSTVIGGNGSINGYYKVFIDLTQSGTYAHSDYILQYVTSKNPNSGSDPKAFVWAISGPATIDGNAPTTPNSSQFSSTFLQWSLTNSSVGQNFNWWVQTLAGDGTTVLETSTIATATPIPNAAWLLGSGIIGLIGLQRRRARKAK